MRGWGPCGRPRWGHLNARVTLFAPHVADPDGGRPQGPHPRVRSTPAPTGQTTYLCQDPCGRPDPCCRIDRTVLRLDQKNYLMA